MGVRHRRRTPHSTPSSRRDQGTFAPSRTGHDRNTPTAPHPGQERASRPLQGYRQFRSDSIAVRHEGLRASVALTRFKSRTPRVVEQCNGPRCRGSRNLHNGVTDRGAAKAVTLHNAV